MMLFRDFLDFLLFSTIQDNYFWNGQVKALQIFHRFLLQRKKIKNKMKRRKKHFTILLSHSLKFVMMNWSSPPVHISWRIFIFLSFFLSFFLQIRSIKKVIPSFGTSYVIIQTKSGVAYQPLFFFGGGLKEFFTFLSTIVTLSK
jgi:membrane-associated HD superfamily phosphohydrolase